MVFIFNPIAPEIPIENPYPDPPTPGQPEGGGGDDEEGGTDTDRDIPEPDDTDTDSDIDQMAQSLDSETLWTHMVVSGAEAGSALSTSVSGIFVSLSQLEQACANFWEEKPYKKHLKKSQKQLLKVVNDLDTFIHYHRYERSCLAETNKRIGAHPKPSKELQPFAQTAVLNLGDSHNSPDITKIEANSSVDLNAIIEIQETLTSIAEQIKSGRKNSTDMFIDAFTNAQPSEIDNGLNKAISEILKLVIDMNEKASASRLYAAVSKP
ncbi:MAG: hypothetical protein ACRBHB_05505 [Arenicella sp.]